jgi:hypothetical protein
MTGLTAKDHDEIFGAFASPVIGLPVSHVWRGYGSALFLEIGRLHQPRRKNGSMLRPDGTPLQLRGEWTVMIEWSWRIEGPRSILCGSWSDEKRWPRAFGLLKNANIISAKVFGNLPEIEIILSNNVRVLSFNTSNGDPAWSLLDKREPPTRWISVERGVLCVGASTPKPTA